MPLYFRNLLLILILSVWLGYGAISYLSFHILPPYEYLLIPSAAIAVLSSPGSVAKVLKKFIPEKPGEGK